MPRFLASEGGVLHRLTMCFGWLGLAAIGYATLSPIEQRPSVADTGFEHIVAFGFVAAAFAIAYPKRMPLVLGLLLAADASLEVAQLGVEGRHARLIDFSTKAVGVIVVRALHQVCGRWRRRRQA